MAKDFVNPTKPAGGRPDPNPPDEKPFAMTPPPPPKRLTKRTTKDKPKE